MGKARTDMDFGQYLENLENKLRSSFDVYRNHTLGNKKYDLFAKYYIRTERYILTKKTKVYGLENNEYILLKYFESMDLASLNEFKETLISSIDHVVDPHGEHMSSIITGVVVTDLPLNVISDQVADSARKFKYHKGFSFGLKGWVDIRLLIVSLKDGIVISNRKGREVEKVYLIS